MDLSRVGARENLKPRPNNEPHWQRLAPGRFLGYRPSLKSGSGRWVARLYDADARVNRKHALGSFANLPPNERFSVARREAEAWFRHVDGGGSRAPITVADACRNYAESRPAAGARFERLIYHDPISRVELHRLRKRHVQEWRDRLEVKPALVTRKKNDPDPVYKQRSAADINRNMTALRAALNSAFDQGWVASNAAWAVTLRPIKNADRRRNLYLDRDQRRALLAGLDGEAFAFVHALCLLPLRPGAMAALSVGDFDPRRNELTIGKDKTGARRIIVPEKVGVLLKGQQTEIKGRNEPLFQRPEGGQWTKDYWKKPIKKAAIDAKLPESTSAYTIRHSTITDLVISGLDLFTVARLAGTSVSMIERYYGHLRQDHAAAALATLTL